MQAAVSHPSRGPGGMLRPQGCAALAIRTGRWFWALGLCCLLAGSLRAAPQPAPDAAAVRKVALVVGNSRYRDSPLTNPVNDALAMGRTLRDVGFTVNTLTDATLAQMTDAVRAFGDSLGRGDVGLFYYAGHGMQIKGRNYLIPVDADVRREDEAQYKSFDANQVLDKMESARNPINIVILDACRNNPFARSFRSSSTGLAQMEAPVGTYISFATAPGKVASDGKGDNGLFTQHLLRALRTPSLKVEDVFKLVRLNVMKDSGHQQVPWDSSSLTGDFYFLPPARPALEPQAPPTPLAVPPAVATVERARPEPMKAPPAPAVLPKGRDLAQAQELFRKGQEAQKRGDIKAALEPLEAAAEQGLGSAQYELGLLRKVGRAPVRQDLEAARRWFGKAAEQGNVPAQYEFGKLAAAGQGGPKSCREAQRWLHKAATGGHLDAMVQLAGVLQRGCDGERKPEEAARWLKAAAVKGSRDAQFSLGVLYFSGEGVAKDPKEARRWLEAAAAQGHPSTKLYLARLD